MAHIADTFPYAENESGQKYIFSALDCDCTRDLFDIAEQEGTINREYKDTLIQYLYTPKDEPKPPKWETL